MFGSMAMSTLKFAPLPPISPIREPPVSKMIFLGVERSLSMDFGATFAKFCIFRLGFSKKEVCFAAVYLSISWGVAAVPACSVIMGIIIVIDKSCNNGRN